MRYFYLIIALLFALANTSCQQKSKPKQREYFRITFPNKEVVNFDTLYPYKFQYPKYANIKIDTDINTEPFWININFNSFNANVHVSYKKIENNLEQLLQDSRTLVYKHVVKADAIEEIMINKTADKVYGIIYYIKGNAATPVQFFVTDSTKHFLRASLYFNVYPNKDSLAPAISFLTTDIEKIIETFQWKN